MNRSEKTILQQERNVMNTTDSNNKQDNTNRNSNNNNNIITIPLDENKDTFNTHKKETSKMKVPFSTITTTKKAILETTFKDLLFTKKNNKNNQRNDYDELNTSSNFKLDNTKTYNQHHYSTNANTLIMSNMTHINNSLKNNYQHQDFFNMNNDTQNKFLLVNRNNIIDNYEHHNEFQYNSVNKDNMNYINLNNSVRRNLFLNDPNKLDCLNTIKKAFDCFTTNKKTNEFNLNPLFLELLKSNKDLNSIFNPYNDSINKEQSYFHNNTTDSINKELLFQDPLSSSGKTNPVVNLSKIISEFSPCKDLNNSSNIINKYNNNINEHEHSYLEKNKRKISSIICIDKDTLSNNYNSGDLVKLNNNAMTKKRDRVVRIIENDEFKNTKKSNLNKIEENNISDNISFGQKENSHSLVLDDKSNIIDNTYIKDNDLNSANFNTESKYQVFNMSNKRIGNITNIKNNSLLDLSGRTNNSNLNSISLFNTHVSNNNNTSNDSKSNKLNSFIMKKRKKLAINKKIFKMNNVNNHINIRMISDSDFSLYEKLFSSKYKEQIPSMSSLENKDYTENKNNMNSFNINSSNIGSLAHNVKGFRSIIKINKTNNDNEKNHNSNSNNCDFLDTTCKENCNGECGKNKNLDSMLDFICNS